MKNIALRSILGFIIIIILLPTANAAEFPDVTEDIFAYKAISVFAADGTVDGYPDGFFRPQKAINRVEALKIILLAMPSGDETHPELKFTDFAESEWFAKYVKQGVARGMLTGYPDKTFKPAMQVNFAESLKMGLLARGIPIEAISEDSVLHPSIVATEWYAKYFKFGADKNLYDINADGTLDPSKPMSRGDFVELIYRIKNFDPVTGFDVSYNWQEAANETGITTKYPFYWDVYKLDDDGLFLGYFEGKNPNFVHTKPNDAKTAFTFWANPTRMSASEYFADQKLQYENDYTGEKVDFHEGFSDNGPSLLIEIPSKGIMDYYIYLKDGRILVGQGAYDYESNKATDFADEIRKVYSLTNFDPNSGTFLDIDEKLSKVRKYLLVDGKGLEMLKLFEDRTIIETDTLGVGTGPVDYYYSEVADYTFKYERSSDVILDIHEGESSSF